MITPLTLLEFAAIAAAGTAAWLATPASPGRTLADRTGPDSAAAKDSDGWLVRYRWLLSLLSGVAGVTLAAPPLSWVVGLGLSAWTWVVIGRAERSGARSEAVAVARDLVPLVGLLSAALDAGSPPGRALVVSRLSLPGPAADRLAVVTSQLELGGDPQTAWGSIAGDPVLGALGRAVARAEQTGAPIALIVSKLADELAERSRAEVEDRARAVGVKAAVPLGLCLLPSFLLIGIVPVAASLMQSLV